MKILRYTDIIFTKQGIFLTSLRAFIQIRETWYHIYRRHFYKRAVQQAVDCKKGFYYYQRGFQDTEVFFCSSFWMLFFPHNVYASPALPDCFMCFCSRNPLYHILSTIVDVQRNALSWPLQKSKLAWCHPSVSIITHHHPQLSYL